MGTHKNAAGDVYEGNWTVRKAKAKAKAKPVPKRGVQISCIK